MFSLKTSLTVLSLALLGSTTIAPVIAQDQPGTGTSITRL